MSKSDITELLKKKDLLIHSYGKEVDFIKLVVERINERDYAGLVAVSQKSGVPLKPLYEVLANKTLEYMKTGQLPRSYEYYVLELMFSGKGESARLADLSGGHSMEEAKVRELHFLLTTTPFGEKQVSRLKSIIQDWDLSPLQHFIWELGLGNFFSERARELGSSREGGMTVKQVMEKHDLKDVFAEDQLIDDFIYFEKEKKQFADGIKTDLYLEKTSREKVEGRLEKLYALFESYPCDFDRLKEQMIDLHMNRQVAKIELDGIDAFRKYIDENWTVGAGAVARRYGFSWHGETGDSTGEDLKKVNENFLNQAVLNKKGKSFLCWEAVLNNYRMFHAARSYVFPGRYLVVVFSPEEEEEHCLYGYYPLDEERNSFFARCLAEVYRYKILEQSAQQLILQYMEEFSGAVRIKNAVRIALLALPVVALVSVMVGWIFHYTLQHTLGSVLVGGVLFLIGEAIAARNGYSRKIKPDSHEKIPEYVVRQRGVVKIMPVSLEQEQV
ncbi:MAG: hypothetical protein JXQ83_09835 [Candidatus Glassbacteria bacterium]|nr:hypothetical protein [Candidatus Glassbacteria bacterium]